MATALFIGRFQPLHSAHFEVIKNILKENNRIIIGIGSSQESNTRENPFSYSERREMIEQLLTGNEIDNFEICEIPDFFDDEKWTSYIKEGLPHFDIAYSGNPVTISCLSESGINVKKIDIIGGISNAISSTVIRQKISRGGGVSGLVPDEIMRYIKKMGGVERIKNLCS